MDGRNHCSPQSELAGSRNTKSISSSNGFIASIEVRNRAPPRAQDIAPDPWRFSFDLYAAKRDGCAGSLNIDRDDFGASDHLVRDLGEEVVDRQLPLLNGRCPHHQDYGQPESVSV